MVSSSSNVFSCMLIVYLSFSFICFSCGYYTNFAITFRMDNNNHDNAFKQAKTDLSRLAIFLSIVNFRNRSIVKHRFGALETYAVISYVFAVFIFIPLE